MLRIDGSFGEGGGQILRTSLALSLVTGRGIRVEGIRSKRKRPGLMRQHLAAVRAATEVGNARVEGDRLGSTSLTFEPVEVRAGTYHFAVGTAGSATLVFQTVLPALLRAKGPSELTLEGGTHNPAAPPFDFLERSFLPAIRRLGAHAQVELHRRGFYPAGGGRFTAHIDAPWDPTPLSWMERGPVLGLRACAIVSQLPAAIAGRELATLRDALDLPCDLRTDVVPHPFGPGNALVVDVEAEHGTEVVTGFGERGVRAETVANRLAAEVNQIVKAAVPVGEHLADQLLPYLALGRGGQFLTVRPSSHTTTQIELLQTFLGRKVTAEPQEKDAWWVQVGS